MTTSKQKPTDRTELKPNAVRRSLAALNGTPEERQPAPTKNEPATAKEVGGPEGPDPTRYGDWERKGRCIDF